MLYYHLLLGRLAARGEVELAATAARVVENMETLATPTFTIQRAGERASFDHGWLQTNHSFSSPTTTIPAT